MRIGTVSLGTIPRVVLGVDGNAPAVTQAAEAGVDILEVRVDLFEHVTADRVRDEVKALKRHGLPLIGTIRSPKEGGGRAKLTDAQRLELYDVLAPLVDAIDVELHASIVKSVSAAARRHEATLILSYHDFQRTPAAQELERISEAATALNADVVKIATSARSEDDVRRLLRFTLEHRERRLVTIAMGQIGSVSRLLFPLAGSLLTYTSISPSDGQIPAQRLVEDLRFYYPQYNEELITRLGLLEYA